MQLTHWNPLRELHGISERLNRLFTPHREDHQKADQGLMTAADWSPSVDVLETDEEFYLKVDLPEVHKTDVRVTVNKGLLILQGERKEEPDDRRKRIHLLGRPYGRFLRRFTLPDTIDVNHVRAEFKDGILSVHLPKTIESKAKVIDIKAA